MRGYVLVLLVVGCTDSGGDGDSVCGDGRCDLNEVCPSDCDQTPACTTSPDNCVGETICVASTCVAAFPRVYRFTNVAVAMPTTNPNNGQSWDIGGGAPDLYLGDSTGARLSNVVQDQFSATFPGPFEVMLVAGATLRLDVWDDDVTTPDFAYACQANPITAELLRTRSFRCQTGGASLNAVIEPK
jgi:hypothetical protein